MKAFYFDNLTNDPNSNPIYSEAKEVFELTSVKVKFEKIKKFN